MKTKKQQKTLAEIVQTTGNGGHSVTVVYAGPGGYKYSAPVGTLESLRRMGREDETHAIACESFKSLISHESYNEAEKCIRYMNADVLDGVAYETLREAIGKQVESGGNHRDKVDKIAEIYLRNRSQNL